MNDDDSLFIPLSHREMFSKLIILNVLHEQTLYFSLCAKLWYLLDKGETRGALTWNVQGITRDNNMDESI